MIFFIKKSRNMFRNIMKNPETQHALSLHKITRTCPVLFLFLCKAPLRFCVSPSGADTKVWQVWRPPDLTC